MYFPTKTETKLSQGNLDFHYAQDLLFSKKKCDDGGNYWLVSLQSVKIGPIPHLNM